MITTPQSSSSSLSPEEAALLCADVMLKLEAFEAVLAQETAHIAAARLNEGFALGESKSQAAGAYLQAIESLKRQIAPLKILAPESLIRLRERHEALRAALQHNMKTLATVKSVSERLLRDVTADSLKTRNLETYGEHAELTQARRETLTTPIILSKTF